MPAAQMERKRSVRRKQKPPFAQRAKDHCRAFTAFLFSNVGIIILVVLYMTAGTLSVCVFFYWQFVMFSYLNIYNLMIESCYGRFVGGISVFTINLPSQHISCYQSFEIKQH